MYRLRYPSLGTLVTRKNPDVQAWVSRRVRGTIIFCRTVHTRARDLIFSSDALRDAHTHRKPCSVAMLSYLFQIRNMCSLADEKDCVGQLKIHFWCRWRIGYGMQSLSSRKPSPRLRQNEKLDVVFSPLM